MSSLATSAPHGLVASRTLTLGHRYRLGDELGDSGLLAVDATSGATVVVTRVPFGATLRVERDDFVRRSRLLWPVPAAALVRVLDAGDWDDDAYLVEEQIAPPSTTLASRLAALDEPTRTSVAKNVADAIVALHAAGLTHGDLTLDSVFLDAYGEPKLHASLATRATPTAQHAECRRLRALLDEIAPGLAAASTDDSSAADLSRTIPPRVAADSAPLVYVDRGRLAGLPAAALIFLLTLFALGVLAMFYRVGP